MGNLDEELMEMVNSDDALLAWQGVGYTDMTQDEIKEVESRPLRYSARTMFVAKILRDVKPGNGRKIGPFQSKEDAYICAGTVERACHYLGWKSTIQKNGRLASAKSVKPSKGVDGKWYVYVMRKINTVANTTITI